MALYGARRIWPLKTQRTRDNGALRLDGKAIRWRVADEKKKKKQTKRLVGFAPSPRSLGHVPGCVALFLSSFLVSSPPVFLPLFALFLFHFLLFILTLFARWAANHASRSTSCS